MPVSMGTLGQTYTIKCVTGSGEVRSHLEAMGFTSGTEVKIIAQMNGDVILSVKDSRVAVNEEQARHIMV